MSDVEPSFFTDPKVIDEPIEWLLARTSDIRISEAHHSLPDARRYRYEPTYSFRSLSNLHIEVTHA